MLELWLEFPTCGHFRSFVGSSRSITRKFLNFDYFVDAMIFKISSFDFFHGVLISKMSCFLVCVIIFISPVSFWFHDSRPLISKITRFDLFCGIFYLLPLISKITCFDLFCVILNSRVRFWFQNLSPREFDFQKLHSRNQKHLRN